MYTKEHASVRGEQMEVLMFDPERRDGNPGLIVCQHIPKAHAGLESDPWQIGVGERLAKAGYAVAMPFLFHWWPSAEDIDVKRREFRDDWTVADLAAAYDALRNHDGVDGARIAIIGHCWGGRVAWLGACHNSNLKAAVVLYGGRIKLSMADNASPPIELADRIPCPVLGLFGNEDQNPSPADVDDLDAALTEAGVVHEFHRYDGAGHGFQDDSNAERYREAQADDAWEKIHDFLARVLH